MATLILGTVGGVVGTAFGGPIGSAMGKVLGAAGGSLIDGALFGGGTRYVEGPRLSDVAGLTSTEGEPIPRVYGRARLGGTLIWATRPLEVANTLVQRSSSGAKGGGSRTVTTSYGYYANIAVGICAGEIAFVRRVWADGREIDLTTRAMRVHTGRADQAADPLIVAKEGADRAPAYRGLAYVVFERLALADFGNRIPQLAFEVVRPVDGIAGHIRAVCLIPGSTEFGLDPTPVSVDAGLGATRPANRFQLSHASDVLASLNALQALCPNLKRVSVVVSWFGSDLRAGHCKIAPRVDSLTKATIGDRWSVAGLTRLTAGMVSLVDGNPAYGGTPSDAGLVRLVAELNRRGLGTVLYPFLMMDVPAGNALPDPYRPTQSQPAFPWRGRITCDPAPDQPGSPDGTATAAGQVAAFFEGYCRLVLHYAGLLRASGLAGFIIGSELPGLTRVRGPDGYPAVEALRALAQDVRAILGHSAKLVYAADWTEYGAHVREGGATIRFPLDALFADPAIDAVGIDYYPPLSDWRDGDAHADAALAPTIYDRAYLKSRLGAGEAFDWYYASDDDRAAQIRTPISDGAYRKPWIYRAKDLVAWWSNPHVERDGGIETRTTAWVPGSKPIWLTEIGVAAVDRSTNGPNAFPDPKSSENALPPFSRGSRDALIQARGLEAILSRFDPAMTGFEPAHNTVWPGSGLRMVDPEGIFVWCWDARPFPAFPAFDTVWSDASNWALGHWITGRSEGQELDRLIAAILAAFGITAPATIAADGFVDGFVIDRPLSARGVLESLCGLFGLDVSVAAGRLLIRGPQAARPITLSVADLVEPQNGSAPLSHIRVEDGALPRSLEIGFSDGESDEYRRATAAALRPGGTRRRESRIEAAIVSRRGAAQALAEGALDAALAARDTARFSVSPRRLDLEPGDRLILPDGSLHRITRISDSPSGRAVETAGAPVVTADGGNALTTDTRSRAGPPALPGPPFAVALDLPVTRGDPGALQYLAIAADPWPGLMAVWRAAGLGAPFIVQRLVEHPACLGSTLSPLPPGPLWRFDRAARLDVTLRHAEGFASVDEGAALAGANTFALIGSDGTTEILSAACAELIGAGTFRLTTLLRGLAGSEAAASRTVPAGALIVRLDDGAVVPLVERLDEAGREFAYRVGPADRDPGDPAVTGFTAVAGLAAFRPMRPVYLRARREAGGVRFTWIRRSRRDGDAWEPADIPLDEASEAYALDLYRDDGSLVRTLSADMANALYATADEAADFGGAQTMIDAAIAQIGGIAGRGPSTRVRVPIRSA
ncbi:baseplate multidomain protein megatron [Methylobacterium gnaphalii]|uniref:Uncharacterized protein n=1 Tax=Methylobacterium gnaphalii TaxID=1010610 RepID=A0A512JI28_9HYPH|nr:glycoside hydrolase/phage tail family protein [Methylobacterium gnaphalii]GEP09594.1 hypothetical protein MGN01_14390 [Methylobacterium gnaphalii]GJD67819.1 hypothetical protein MMMDOFMJ_0736 [Methylobacterium gnaphalii]